MSVGGPVAAAAGGGDEWAAASASVGAGLRVMHSVLYHHLALDTLHLPFWCFVALPIRSVAYYMLCRRDTGLERSHRKLKTD